MNDFNISNRYDFSNKTIAIFGAAGLIGQAVLKEALKLNARVIALDVSIENLDNQNFADEIKNYKDNLTLVNIDILKSEELKEFFIHNIQLDGVVNATYPKGVDYGTHFLDLEIETFQENISLQLGSAFLIMKHCAKHFLDYENPLSLVNISSIYGVVPPKFEIYQGTSMTTPIEYAAVKSAIIHLNKYVVNYVKDSNFRVNSVSPGGVLDAQPEVFLKAYKKNTRGEGMLHQDDLVGTIMFLLSDASKFVVGQNITIDDGFTL